MLENPIGTACGCYVETQVNGETKRIFTFPGVPSEFKKMFDEKAMAVLSPFIDGSSKLITRRFGFGECLSLRLVSLLEMI